MAVPIIELEQLNQTMAEIIDTLFKRLQREYTRQAAQGTPPKTIVKRFLDQIESEQGIIIQEAKKMGSAITQNMTNIYHTLNREWSTALEASKINPRDFNFFSKVGKNWILPGDAGYSVTVNNLGEKVVKLSQGRARDAIDLLREQRVAERRLQRLQGEEKAAQIAKESGRTAPVKENIMLMWVAVFVNTCKDCLRLNGQVRTRLEWERSGVTPGSGQTVCGNNCKCSLVPVEAMRRSLGVTKDKIITDSKGGKTTKAKSEEEIVSEINKRTENGIKLQKEKINAMAKKRGKQYSEEYEKQMLGQIQGPRFNPYYDSQKRTNLYLRKEPKVSKKFIKDVQVHK